MTLNQLLYFKTISETGSMGQAAKRLFVSQPSLSAAMNRLEEELDISLFDRIGHHLQLTPDGEIFLNYVRKILKDVEEAENRMHLLAENHDHLLRLGCVEPAFNKYVPYIMRKFLDQPENADTQFELFTDTTDELVKRLQNGELDLLLSSVTDDKDVRQMVLYTMPLALLGPKGLRQKDPGQKGSGQKDSGPKDLVQNYKTVRTGTIPSTWEDVARLPLIGYTSDSFMDHLLSIVAEKENVELHYAYLAPNEEAIAALVYHGFGYGIVPVTDTLAANRKLGLYPLPGNHYQTICLTYLAHRSYRGRAGRFIEFMKQVAASAGKSSKKSE